MSTFAEVQGRIQFEYLNRYDMPVEVKSAIRAAIRNYENRRWGFNETSTELTTSAGQKFVAFPSNFLFLDDLRITINSNDLPLNRRDMGWVREARASRPTGPPSDYSLYQNRVELFPIPEAVYTLPISYVKRLTELTADADTNAFLTGAMEDVITYHATKLMWANVIRNDAEAGKYAALERVALTNMTMLQEQYALDKLRPTYF